MRRNLPLPARYLQFSDRRNWRRVSSNIIYLREVTILRVRAALRVPGNSQFPGPLLNSPFQITSFINRLVWLCLLRNCTTCNCSVERSSGWVRPNTSACLQLVQLNRAHSVLRLGGPFLTQRPFAFQHSVFLDSYEECTPYLYWTNII